VKNKVGIILFSIVFSILIWGSVTLSEDFFTSDEFNIKVINQPSGYTCGIISPEKVSVKLKGKGWQLISLALGVENDFALSADTDSGLIQIDPYNEINENNWIGSGLSIVEISPRSVSLNVERIIFKKLKISAETDLSFNDGYGLATPISISPDSVLVAGPKSILEKKETIKTKKLSFTSLDSKVKVISEIEDIPGFKTEISNVELTIDVQRIVEKSFEGIKIEIVDLPADRNIVLIPNTLECSLRGGINILGKINNNQISATVKYRDIVYDTTGSIKPEIIFPKNTQLFFTRPEQINYVIKKFD
jgi:hypothetical protein